MKIFYKTVEKLTDLIQESGWMELAFRRKEIRHNLLYSCDVVVDNLCKIVLLPDHPDKIIWIKNLNSIFTKIIDEWKIWGVKKRYRAYLPYKDYYYFLFEGLLGDGLQEFDNEVNKLNKMGYLIPEMTIDVKLQIYAQIKKIMHKICKDISNDKFSETEEYLKEENII